MCVLFTVFMYNCLTVMFWNEVWCIVPWVKHSAPSGLTADSGDDSAGDPRWACPDVSSGQPNRAAPGPDTELRPVREAGLTCRIADSLLRLRLPPRAQFSFPTERVVAQSGDGALSAVCRRSGLLDAHLRTVTGAASGVGFFFCGVIFLLRCVSLALADYGLPPAGQECYSRFQRKRNLMTVLCSAMFGYN